MSIETIAYLITFVITSGISALAILISMQMYQQYKRPVLAQLLYQQIFLFSFLIYSIWGNIILKTILNDVQMSADLSAKLSVFVPMIGIPFMIVSWYMVLNIAFSLNGIDNAKIYGFIFFPTLVVLILLINFLIYFRVISIPEDANLFVVRILTVINLIIYLVFTLLFIFRKKANSENQSGFHRSEAQILLLAVLISSAVMYFFNQFGYISICISVSLAFLSGAVLPVFIYSKNSFSEAKTVMNFTGFCERFEISKREAEIVLEICKGMSNKAIADKLFITLQTVKDHNHRIFTKTGVKSRVQLANLVREKTGQKS